MFTQPNKLNVQNDHLPVRDIHNCNFDSQGLDTALSTYGDTARVHLVSDVALETKVKGSDVR